MLLLKLNKINDDVVIYDYYPENKEDYGTIELDLNSKEARLIKQADNVFNACISRIIKNAR